MVIVGRDTEYSLFTTTRDGETMALVPAGLGYCLHPVSIVVPVVVLSPTLVVVQLIDVAGIVVLCGIEVGLLQHHGVVITREEVIAIGLEGTGQFQRVAHLGGTLGTTLGGQLDHTVTTLATIDGRGGGILQHVDAGDVEQFGKFLVVGTCHIKVGEVYVADVTVDHDQGVGIGERRERGGTTQTHGGSRTEVTRVTDNIQTGDTSLQSLVY